MKKFGFLVFFSFFLLANGFAQSTASKQVSKFQIVAPQLENERTIWIYLPKSYFESNKTYPVIYMFDAQNLFDAKSSFVGEWEVDEYLDSEEAKEAIVVGIEHGDDKRIEELTPFVHATYGGGKGDLFLEFIINTLKPYVDKSYRTKTETKHTYILGSSLGGLMACYAVIKFSETFSHAGILSPAFWINPEIYDIVSEAKTDNNQRFYFLAGKAESETMIPNIEKMNALLTSKGVPEEHIEKNYVENGEHNEALWRKSFPKVYDWLMTSE